LECRIVDVLIICPKIAHVKTIRRNPGISNADPAFQAWRGRGQVPRLHLEAPTEAALLLAVNLADAR
jgi:hypothetical protein